MKKYDECVNTVMQFLTSNHYGSTAIYEHQNSYKRIKEWLISSGASCTPEALNACFEEHSGELIPSKQRQLKHALVQLIDVYETGSIRDQHVGFQICPYDQLTSVLKQEVDEFVSHCLSEGKRASYVKSLQGKCSDFILFLQNHGVTTIRQVTFDLILLYQSQNNSKSRCTRASKESAARMMLDFFAERGKYLHGHAEAMTILTRNQIVLDTYFIPADSMRPADHSLWETASSFQSALKKNRYSKSVYNYYYRSVVLLLIFLEKNDLALTKEIAELWFEHAKPLSGKSWKSMRRALYQFLHFADTGEIIPCQTTSPKPVKMIDTIPAWCRVEWEDFLAVLQRENRAQSTIEMYRSSISRFCLYFDKVGITGFDQLTPEILIGFNAQDKHETAEGKAAYNSRIRNFICYLEDKGIISNQWLHTAISSIHAPKTRIIDTLPEEAVENFWKVDQEAFTPMERRDYAISCLGLGMGIRSSDIVSLKIADIDWKKQQISFTQMKTGVSAVLPMPVHVGNAIYRYLQIRPQSSSENLFIPFRSPYDKVGRCVCQKALERFIGENKGFHITRRTFATALLRGQTKAAVISDSLGHRSEDTVFKYLHLDEQRTRQCAISLNQLGIFWPKEGAFYG